MGLGKDAMRCDGILLGERGRGRENPARQETRRTATSAAAPTGAVAERQASGRRKLLAFDLGSQSRDDVYRCFVIEL